MSKAENNRGRSDVAHDEAAASFAASGAHRLLYSCTRLGVRTVMHLLAPRLRVAGRSRVPYRGAAILAPNHISHIDSVLLAHIVRRRLRFMAMQEILETPILGPVTRFCGAFPIERDSADRAALRYAEQLLQQGQALVVYPEGRLSPDGKLGPILPGSVLLALRTGVPIVPVGISGSHRLMPYGPTWPRPTLAPISLYFGAALDLSDLKNLPGRARREAATERLEGAMRQAIARAQDLEK